MHHPQASSLFQFFKYFLCAHSLKISSLVVVSTLWSITEATGPYLLKLIIDGVVAYHGSFQGLCVNICIPLGFYIALIFFSDLAMSLQEILISYTIPVIKAEIMRVMFSYVQEHSPCFFQDTLSGTVANKINEMARSFERLFLLWQNNFFPVIFASLLSSLLLWGVHPLYSLFLMIWFMGYLLIANLLARRCIEHANRFAKASSNVMGAMADILRNVNTVRMFSAHYHETMYLQNFQEHEVECARALGWYMFRIRLTKCLASLMLLLLMIGFLLYGWHAQWSAIGDFAFIISTTVLMIRNIAWLADEMLSVYRELGIAHESLQLMSTDHKIKDKFPATSLNINNAHIIFSHVNFSYQKSKQLFSNLTVTIQSGEKVGLVGFSGSGKTSFVNLIMRFFDIDSGEILIDGQDIRSVTQQSLRTHIMMIPQDPILFCRTLMDNIRFGNIHATDAQVIDAARRAHCHDFIIALPEGYQTLVGERGVKLSTGQRQRIIIARGMLKDSPILILDEATASLDAVTERNIQESLQELMQGRTSIVIAHRLSTLINMDRILVFHQGAIIESGNHDELIACNGHYAMMWHLQVNGFNQITIDTESQAILR